MKLYYILREKSKHCLTDLNPLKQLEHEIAVVGVSQRLGGLYDAVKVGIEQLHHYVQLVVVLANEQIFQGHDVRVGPKVPVHRVIIAKKTKKNSKQRDASIL